MAVSNFISIKNPKASARRADLLARLRACTKAQAGDDAKIRAGVLAQMRDSLSQGRDEARAHRVERGGVSPPGGDRVQPRDDV